MKKNEIKINEVKELGYDSENYIDPKLSYTLHSETEYPNKKNKLSRVNNPVKFISNKVETLLLEMSEYDKELMMYVLERGMKLTNSRALNKWYKDQDNDKTPSTNRIKLILGAYTLYRDGYDVNTPKKLKRFLQNNNLSIETILTHKKETLEEIEKNTINVVTSNTSDNINEYNLESINLSGFDQYYSEVLKVLDVSKDKVDKVTTIKEVLGGYYDDYLQRKKGDKHTPLITTNLITQLYKEEKWSELWKHSEDVVLKRCSSNIYVNKFRSKEEKIDVALRLIKDENISIRKLENSIQYLKKHCQRQSNFDPFWV